MASARGKLPTTAAGAEYGLALAFVILRVFDLVQLAVATPSSLSQSPNAQLDVGLAVMFASWSALMCTIVMRRRRLDDPRLVWIDVAAGSLVLLATPLFTQPADRFSSWAGWGYAITLSVIVGAGIGLRSLWQTMLAVAILGGLYLVASLPAATTSADTLTAITNSLDYVGFAVVIRFPAGYMRRLGADADAAREQAGMLAREAERARHRVLLHDQASVLSLLSREDADPALASIARSQAGVGATRVRAFLTNDEVRATSLGQALQSAVAEFGDLDIELNDDGIAGEVGPTHVRVIADAVRTLLHNVRNHAQASQIVIYAAATGEQWEVQVSDNGVGFDPAAVVEGFGLSQQVRAGIASIDGTVDITSAPGEGTSVHLTGANR